MASKMADCRKAEDQHLASLRQGSLQKGEVNVRLTDGLEAFRLECRSLHEICPSGHHPSQASRSAAGFYALCPLLLDPLVIYG